jgi:hypothetical protein
MNGFFAARSGAPFSVSASNASLNAGAGTNQRADQVKPSVQILGGAGSSSPYFDVTAFALSRKSALETRVSIPCAGPESSISMRACFASSKSRNG